MSPLAQMLLTLALTGAASWTGYGMADGVDGADALRLILTLALLYILTLDARVRAERDWKARRAEGGLEAHEDLMEYRTAGQDE